MTKGPDRPDEHWAEQTAHIFASDHGAGADRGRTEPMIPPPPGDEGIAGEFSEKDSTSPEVTDASPWSGQGDDQGAMSAHSPGAESNPISLGRDVPEPGKVLFSTYLVERHLGGGAMGTVWLVRNLELDTLRALKLIVPSFAFDPDAQARFRREAHAMARVKHPNAVNVHAARISREVAYIEMEYVSGKSLDRILQKGIFMDRNWVARVLAQLCDVLHEAHNNHVVHRDLKPSNLMLVDSLDPAKIQLKVLDFGIAKVLENDTSDVHTSTGQFMGTAQYTSPEQASGDAIDHRSDIYSVGVILYELLAGARPFTGPVHQLIFGHLYSPPPRFADRTPPVSMPPEVERVVFRCLAKNPEGRPQSALAVSEAFSTAVFGVASPPAPRPESGLVSIPNPGASPPSVRSADLPPTEKATQAGEQEAPADWAPQPAENGTASDDDWESPPTPTTFPGTRKRSRRTWIVLSIALVALPAPAYLFLSGFPVLGLRLPRGYMAAYWLSGGSDPLSERLPPSKIHDRVGGHGNPGGPGITEKMPQPSPTVPPEPEVLLPAPRHRPFRGTKDVLAAIGADLRQTHEVDRRFQRYFSFTNLHNDLEHTKDDELRAARMALTDVVNSVNRKPGFVKLESIDKDETILKIDLRDVDWEGKNPWEVILRYYPYGVTHVDDHDQAVGRLANEVNEQTWTAQPYVRADWFVATATCSPLRDALLGAVQKPIRDLPERVGVLVRQYKMDLGASDVAGELGIADVKEFLKNIQDDPSFLPSSLKPLKKKNGRIKREEWDDLFEEVIGYLKLGVSYRAF